MVALSRRRRAPARDGGAAAVEFAIVLPVLILILFAIIDYGIYFSDALDARSGVQTAARDAIVGVFDKSCTPFPTDTDELIKPQVPTGYLMCTVKQRTNPLAGTTYVAVALPSNPTPPAEPTDTTTGWYPGGDLTLCEVTVVKGVTGFVPLPNHGVIQTKVVMQIEDPPQDPTLRQADYGGDQPHDTSLPPGGWTWCTPDEPTPAP